MAIMNPNAEINVDPIAYNPAVEGMLNGMYANANTGLSPEAKTALTRESTTGLQDRYNGAASNLRTQLLQRGMYGGALPANPGALLRGFGPLQSDLANAQSKAGADTIIADESEKDVHRNQALTAAGIDVNMTGAKNNQKLNAAQILAGLETTPMKNILMASLLGTGIGALTDPNVIKTIGSFFGKGKGAAVGAGASAAGGMLTAGIPGITAPTAAELSGTMAGMANAGLGFPAAAGGGTAAAGTAAAAGGAAPLTGYAGGGLITSHGAVIGALTNPITIGVAAAVLGAIAWKKSQVHPSADKFVQSYQKPFEHHLFNIVDEFDRSYATGKMDRTTAQAMRDNTANYIASFDQDIAQYRTKGGHEKIVADQAKAEMVKDFGANWEAILDKMDGEIAALSA